MQKRKKILLVDDDVDFVEILSLLLERNGFDVVAAYSADACREIVRHEKPNCIILDVMMDSLTTGFNLARELHSDRMTKNIPLIFVTAIARRLQFEWNHDTVDYTWLPVNAILEKPISPERLLAEIDKRVGASSSGEY